MAPLPVIDNVFRVAYEWGDIGGTTAVNVFHVKGTDAGDDPGDILNSITSTQADHRDCFACLPGGSVMTRVVVTKLDGSSAAVVGNISGTFGTGAGAIEPAVAGLLHIGTGQRGPRGRGRLYIGPIAEDMTGNGKMESAVRATMQTAWQDFTSDLADEVDTSANLGVASYVHSDFHEQVALVMELFVATQRRRQDRVRG